MTFDFSNNCRCRCLIDGYVVFLECMCLSVADLSLSYQYYTVSILS